MNFKYLFFYLDGILYGVWGNKFYKGLFLILVFQNWIVKVMFVGNGGW